MVEITESSLFADLDLARTIVTSLKNQGIRLALDDFGTGFSSLAHLRSLPFDVIKIDRSFVSTLAKDPESAAIVRAVTTLAEALQVPVTVEGIEDAATHAAVAGFGCAVGQGWYFGKPMSGDQATALLRSRQSAPEPAPAAQSQRGQLTSRPIARPVLGRTDQCADPGVDAMVKMALSISDADRRNDCLSAICAPPVARREGHCGRVPVQPGRRSPSDLRLFALTFAGGFCS